MRFLFALLTLFAAASAVQAEKCNIPLKELSPGVTEVNLGMIRVKFEPSTNTIKMKLINPELVEDWTSASTDKGQARITGYVEKDGEQYLFSQLLVRPRNGEFDWALFRSEKFNLTGTIGTGYFYANGEARCLHVSAQKWVSAVRKIFGDSFTDSSAIRIPYNEEL